MCDDILTNSKIREVFVKTITSMTLNVAIEKQVYHSFVDNRFSISLKAKSTKKRRMCDQLTEQ